MSSYTLPPLYLRSVNEDELSDDTTRQLHEWKTKANQILLAVRDTLARTDVPSDDDVAIIIAKAVPLGGYDAYSSEAMRTTANEIMAKLPDPTLEVVTRVLSEHVKPRFLTAPHPMLNASSGRKLPRTAGGPVAAQDFYEEQEWKARPGTANLLLWCIEHLKSDDYESVWHLVVPPTMTLLDDYEASFKIKGVEAVAELLQRVPPPLLRKTGVDGLLAISLRATMVHLHSPLTPKLLRKSIPTFLRLIACTKPPESKARFDQLCALLGDGIIGGIWLFSSDEREIEASMAVLPDVVRELGSGGIRYLKTLIPQILHNISPPHLQRRSTSLQIASLHALETIIEVCQPRIHKWKDTIMETVAKCWVSVTDTTFTHDQSSTDLRQLLHRVSFALRKSCPSVVEDEYKRLLACDNALFTGLLKEPDIR